MFKIALFLFFIGTSCGPSKSHKNTPINKFDSLNLNLENFKSESLKVVQEVFDDVDSQSAKVGYVDGWVSLSDGGIAADHAGLIYSVDIPQKYFINDNLQAILSVGARGSLDFLLLQKSDLEKNVWAPKAWEFLITPKSHPASKSVHSTYQHFKKTGLSNIQISSSVVSIAQALYNQLKFKYKNLYIQFYDQIGIISVSAFEPQSETLIFSRKQATDISRFISEQKRLIDDQDPDFKLELSGLMYRIPHAFSDVSWLNPDLKKFDLQKFRSVSLAASLEGWFFITLPAFPPPYGVGPVRNPSQPKVTYQIIFKPSANFQDCLRRVEFNGGRVLEKYDAINIVLVNFENEEAFNKVSNLICIESIKPYQP
jgi:hypothetical protein